MPKGLLPCSRSSHLHNIHGLLTLRPTLSSRITTSRLSATDYSIYSQLPSTCGGRILHRQIQGVIPQWEGIHSIQLQVKGVKILKYEWNTLCYWIPAHYTPSESSNMFSQHSNLLNHAVCKLAVKSTCRFSDACIIVARFSLQLKMTRPWN